MQEENMVLFLDTQTNNKELRMTSFADDYSSLINDFFNWKREHTIKKEDLWYADIFTAANHNTQHIASLEIVSDDEMLIVPAPKGSTLTPYCENKSIIKQLHNKIRGLKVSPFSKNNND